MDPDPARLFITGFSGPRLDRATGEEIFPRGLRPAGVILFDRDLRGARRNIVSPRQVAELCARLRQEGGKDFIVCVDQEGGRVRRLREEDGFQPLPAAAELGRMEPSAAEAAVLPAAREMAALGITCNLAPVVDLDLNADNPIIGRHLRSFGRDADTVVRSARAFIQAHHHAGLACVIKHFPGHGSAGADSHLGMVDVTQCWREQELAPFARLTGLADGVMSAHVLHRGLDAELPATLSRTMIRTVLRERLGFRGPVLSDDMQMRAITDHFGFARAVRLALLAGVDGIVIGNMLAPAAGLLEQGREVILGMLERGEIGPEDIRASIRRLARLARPRSPSPSSGKEADNGQQ